MKPRKRCKIVVDSSAVETSESEVRISTISRNMNGSKVLFLLINCKF